MGALIRRRLPATLVLSLLVLPLFIQAVAAQSLAPPEAGLAVAPGNDPFQRTWARTDDPVANGLVSRTWMWGPEANTGLMQEPYSESPGGQRTVQYFDKSRMEITDPNAADDGLWYVTNGLLVVELITGKMQVGNSDFEQRSAASVNVAGDADDPTGPTYATFGALLDVSPSSRGTTIIRRVDRSGNITSDPSLAGQAVTVAFVDSVTDHAVATPFWDFMTAGDMLVYEDGQYITGELYDNPYFAGGRPVTEPYWASVKVGGTYKDVLMQCFERRCLTYTPDNPSGWQVEAGNVGQHYWTWRYEGRSETPYLPSDLATPSANSVIVDPASGDYVVGDELLVIFESGISDTAIRDVAQRFGGTIIGGAPSFNVYQLRFENTTYDQLVTLRSQLVAESQVAAVTRNWLIAAPTGDRAVAQVVPWNVVAMNLPDAWGITTGTNEVMVAIIDSGLNRDHVDLKPNLYDYWAAEQLSLDARLKTDHGTHVAGIACGDGFDSQGSFGVAWTCRLGLYNPYRSRWWDLDGLHMAYTDLITALVQAGTAAENAGAKLVVNMSFGAGKCVPSESNRESNETYAEIFRLNPNILWVAGAGNDGCDARNFSPAGAVDLLPSANSALTVAATQQSGDFGSLWSKSNYGSVVTVAAPGASIISSIGNGSDTGTLSGTSMAAPHVTGLAALVWAAHPGFSAQQVKQCIVDSGRGREVTDPVGNRIPVIDAYKAVLCGDEPPGEGPGEESIAAPGPVETFLWEDSQGPVITVAWGDQSGNETGFRLYRRTPNGSWSLLETLPANTEEFDDHDVDWQDTWCYSVIAFNSATESPRSAEECGTLPPDPSPQVPNPFNLTAAGGVDSSGEIPTPFIYLHWAHIDYQVDGFNIYWHAPGNDQLHFMTSVGVVDSYYDYAVSFGDTWCYRMTAFVGNTESIFSNSACGTVPEAEPAPACANPFPSATQVVVFEHTYYGGRCEVFNVNTGNPDLNDSFIGNDTISSLRVGSDVTAFVCEHTYDGGLCEFFDFDDPDLHNNGIGNDTISSIRVIWGPTVSGDENY